MVCRTDRRAGARAGRVAARRRDLTSGCDVFVLGPASGKERQAVSTEENKQLVAAYFAAFDVDDTPEFLVAEDDMVVIHDTYRFKHTGAFQGIPATGKEASITGTDIYRIAEGKIVEQREECDKLNLMQRLGVVPTPGQGTP